MLSITSPSFAINTQPQGLTEMKHRVYYAPELNGYLEEFTGDLVFWGAEYKYLRDTFRTGACSIVPVEINDGCGLILNANIFLNEAEWRPDICSVTVQVVDAGFLSLIDNNMGIKAYVNVPRSKNDVDISAYVTVQTDLEFKADTIVDASATGRQGMRVYDVYKMLIAFMTDGLLEFESDFLLPDDTETTLRVPALITADELRNGRAEPVFPYISFEDFHKDMVRLYNLSFNVVDGVFRVEPSDYFRQSSNVMTMANPSEINQKADEKSFYQKVKFGSQSDENEDFDYYPNITFLGFQQEEYHLGGQCNNKSVLNLQLTELITDVNIIMAALPPAQGGSADLNSKAEDIFIVTFDALNVSVVDVNPIDVNRQYYNKLLTNFEVSLRWGDGIPFSIFQFLGENQNGALSYLNSIYTPAYENFTGQIGFGAYLTFGNQTPPEGFDPNSNMSYSTDIFAINQLITPLWVAVNYYNNGNTIYTVPVSSVYTVIFSIRLPSITPFVAAAISVFDSASSDIVQWFNFDQTNIVVEGGAYVYSASATISCNTGDRIAIGLRNGTQVLNGSTFQVNDLDFIEKTYNPEDNYLIETSFDYPLTSGDWQSFLNDRHGLVTVPYSNGTVRGYLKDVSRSLNEGITEWKISSNFGNS
tara:strand:+ start:6639 stop:8573 length:1935 start_codon:yes stop_codon:yes gene_type:complete